MDERINNLVDEVTGGLADDPELRLDVRAELANHLEESAQAFQEEGRSEAESVAEAVKVFGSPLDLAGEILDANKRRMKLRALARLTIRAFLIPAALVIALWMGYVNARRHIEDTSLLRYMDAISGSSIPGADRPELSLAMKVIVAVLFNPRRPWSDAWLASQTTTEIPMASWSTAMPAFAQAHANNRMYWGYYSTTHSLTPDLEMVAQHGMEIDPDNALYHYELAMMYLAQAVDEKGSTAPGPVIYTCTVRDPVFLEKGLRELREGMRKPYLRTYRREVMRERLSRLPAPKYFPDYSLRLLRVALELYPELSRYRETSRRAPVFAEYLVAHGHRADAIIPLSFPQRISEQFIRDADSFLHIQVARDIAAIGAGEPAQVADRIGRHDCARALREWNARFEKIGMHANDTPVSGSQVSEIHRLWQSGGVMANILIPYLSRGGVSFSGDELSPSRALDYWFIERFSASLLLYLFTGLLLACALLWGFWLLAAGKMRKSCILLLPTWQVVLRIFGYGLLLPVTLYILYAHIPLLSGRGENIAANANRVLIEQVVLIGLVFLVPIRLAGQYLKHRCRQLGLPIPVSSQHNWRKVLFFTLLPCWLVSLYYLGRAISFGWINAPTIILEGLAGLFLLWLLITAAMQQRSCAVYYGTYFRSLVPVYALAIILLTAVVQPYVNYREVRILAEDQLIYTHGTEPGISPIENRVVEKIKAELFPTEEKPIKMP